jgi:uncharacterized protein involved in type VI secretion and phage assembly
MSAAAGEKRGWYWIPETGDRIWVVSSADAPERITVIGSARGLKEEVPADWNSKENAVKIMKFRNHLEIRVDEKEGSISLRTEKAQLILNNQGEILLDAETINEKAKQVIDIKASRDVNVDGAKINLG